MNGNIYRARGKGIIMAEDGDPHTRGQEKVAVMQLMDKKPPHMKSRGEGVPSYWPHQGKLP